MYLQYMIKYKLSERGVPSVLVFVGSVCESERHSQAAVLLGPVPGCSAGAQSEASQRKPTTRFTAPGLDEAKVLFGLE